MLKRGDIYWVNLDDAMGAEPKKKRPCVLIGATSVSKARQTVVIVPLFSSGKPRPPLAIPVTCLGYQTIAVCDQIRAIDKARLIERIGRISKQDLLELERGLHWTLSF